METLENSRGLVEQFNLLLYFVPSHPDPERIRGNLGQMSGPFLAIHYNYKSFPKYETPVDFDYQNSGLGNMYSPQ